MPNDSEDYWSHLDKRAAPELDALIQAEASLPPDFTDPLTSASVFVSGLSDPIRFGGELAALVHPATSGAWADFTAAARGLASIEDWGLGSIADRAPGNSQVAYVKILRHVTGSFQVLSDQVVPIAAVLTMVWSSAQGRWLVFGFGEAIDPARIPPLD